MIIIVKGIMRLWDDNIRLLNFSSRFIYSVLQMLACSFWYLIPNNYHNILMKLLHTIHYTSHQNYAKCHQKRYWSEYRSEPSSFFVYFSKCTKRRHLYVHSAREYATYRRNVQRTPNDTHTTTHTANKGMG